MIKVDTKIAPKTNYNPVNVLRNLWERTKQGANYNFKYVTMDNDSYIRQAENIQNALYQPEISDTVELSVKNGNKEFKVSKVMDDHIKKHNISLFKKDSLLCDFSVIHSEYDDFYLKSTGEYGGNIIDTKFIKVFNGIMEEWLPRLLKKYKRLIK